jgi:hypothetical protein
MFAGVRLVQKKKKMKKREMKKQTPLRTQLKFTKSPQRESVEYKKYIYIELTPTTLKIKVPNTQRSSNAIPNHENTQTRTMKAETISSPLSLALVGKS